MSEIGGIVVAAGYSHRSGRAMMISSSGIGTLNNDPLGLDMKLGEFLFIIVVGGIGIVIIVAGIDAYFDLCVDTSIDF